MSVVTCVRLHPFPVFCAFTVGVPQVYLLRTCVLSDCVRQKVLPRENVRIMSASNAFSNLRASVQLSSLSLPQCSHNEVQNRLSYVGEGWLSIALASTVRSSIHAPFGASFQTFPYFLP